MKCAVCDQYNASLYSENSEDWYCVDCYEEYQIQINCDCENGCRKCEYEED
jgi:hypothetical protein